MTLDPRQLANLLAVAEHGSFNRAAAARGLSQPALSSSIALLERRLGMKVLERTPSGSKLNEVGQLLVRQARTLEALLQQTSEEVRLKHIGVEGPLRIGATPSLMLKFMPDVIERLMQEYPAIAIQMTEGLDDRLQPALREGQLDLIFCPLASTFPTSDDVIAEPLFHDAFSIGIGPKNPLAKRRSLTLSDLRDAAWVLPGPGNGLRVHMEAIFMTAGIPWPSNCVTTTSLPMIESILKRSEHVTLITSILQDAWRVRSIALKGAGTRLIGITYRKVDQLAPLALRLMQIARELVQSNPDIGKRFSPRRR